MRLPFLQTVCLFDSTFWQIRIEAIKMKLKHWFPNPIDRATGDELPVPDIMSMPHIWGPCSYSDADGSCILFMNQDVDKVVECREYEG